MKKESIKAITQKILKESKELIIKCIKEEYELTPEHALEFYTRSFTLCYLDTEQKKPISDEAFEKKLDLVSLEVLKNIKIII